VLWGLVPIYSFNAGSERNTSINIGAHYVSSFYNPEQDPEYRIFCLSVFGPEFAHAVKNTFNKRIDNSLEEEMTASMIGYNIASRILKNRELTREETHHYNRETLKALLEDEHRYLPLYSGYIQRIWYKPAT